MVLQLWLWKPNSFLEKKNDLMKLYFVWWCGSNSEYLGEYYFVAFIPDLKLSGLYVIVGTLIGIEHMFDIIILLIFYFIKSQDVKRSVY